MRPPLVLILPLFLLALQQLSPIGGQQLPIDEHAARRFMTDLNAELGQLSTAYYDAFWAYDANVTEHNNRQAIHVATSNERRKKQKTFELRAFDYAAFSDADLRRQFEQLSVLGIGALPADKLRAFLDAKTAMQTNYAKVRICKYQDESRCDLQLEPELSDILDKSRDPDELKYYWTQWYDRAGTPNRENFNKYVLLLNEAAVLNNFTSTAEWWLHYYEDPHFERELLDAFEQIRPLYEQLHAYVRNKLRAKFGAELIGHDQPIPMHLLGNMWAQAWEHIAGETIPYPDRPLLDVTAEMQRQNYTPLKMFQMGDEFFQSLNMTKLPQDFWAKSILEKPSDGRDLICHASAWDFFRQDDVRIKQCTRVTMDQFFVAHHELGHIQYYLQYQHQPTVYRNGANPGFHEAVGDVLALSVATPKHLQKVGLLSADYVHDEAARINQLYRVALTKIVFLPFGYTLDKYRWALFRGEIAANQYNCRFWQMREEYSGIVPPVQRSEADFDPPAKYHVSANVEYLRYVVSHIVQFQFHKAACELAGEYEADNPEKLLSDCDIYQSADAGNALKAMLSLGSSKTWPDAMEVLTGTRQMDSSAILEYFKPLHDWLLSENKKTGAHIGWQKSYNCG